MIAGKMDTKKPVKSYNVAEGFKGCRARTSQPRQPARSSANVDANANANAMWDVLDSIPGFKIVTWTCPTSRGNFDMAGSEPITMDRMRVHVLWRSQPLIAVLVRRFTDRIDPATSLPVKEISGYIAHSHMVRKLSAEETMSCHCTNSHTGGQLQAEPAVVYV